MVTNGTLGTGDVGFPSYYRGIIPSASQLIGIDEALTPIEKNGFSIIDVDVTPDKLTFTMFTCHLADLFRRRNKRSESRQRIEKPFLAIALRDICLCNLLDAKLTYRLYREAGLAVRRRKRKRIGPFERKPLLSFNVAGHSWRARSRGCESFVLLSDSGTAQHRQQ